MLQSKLISISCGSVLQPLIGTLEIYAHYYFHVIDFFVQTYIVLQFKKQMKEFKNEKKKI